MRRALKPLQSAATLVIAALVLAAPTGAAAAPEPRALATGVHAVEGAASASVGVLAWTADAAPGVAAVRPDGTTSPEPTVGLQPGDGVFDAAVSDEGAGALCVVRRTKTFDYQLLVAVRPAGGAFGEPRTIAAQREEVARFLCRVADDGSVLVGWLEAVGLSDYAAFAATVDPAGRVAVRMLASESASDIDVALSPDGRPLAAAVVDDEPRDGIVLAQQQPEGGLGPARRVISTPASASVSLTHDRKVRLLWWGRRRLHRAEGPAARLVRRTIRAPAVPDDYPETAWGGDGTSVSTWLDDPSNPYAPRTAHMAIVRPGRRPRFSVLDRDAGNQTPLAALARDRSGIVTWESRARIVARPLTPAGRVGRTVVLGSLIHGYPVFVPLAWSRGRTLVAWVSRENTLLVR